MGSEMCIRDRPSYTPNGDKVTPPIMQSHPHVPKVIPKRQADPEFMHFQSILNTISSRLGAFFAFITNSLSAYISCSHTLASQVKACPIKKLSRKASKPRSLKVPRRDSRSDNNLLYIYITFASLWDHICLTLGSHFGVALRNPEDQL